MFERFTDKARTAVIAARAEAAERGDQIRPVYLLHALAAGDGVAARALASIGIDLEEITRRVEESFGPGALDRSPGPSQGSGRIAMTREAKQSVELAAREARALRHGYVGTEHLLLGLIEAAQRNPRGDFGPQALKELGIDPAQARQRVLDELRRGST
jgi:ATP-dependent Clp protease ATP-binding subunit ClpC